MPKSGNVTQDRRSGSQQLVNELVNTRTNVLSLYSDLAAQHPFENKENIPDLLEEFCQALIDYTADAHFRLYRYIDEKRERRRSVMNIANQVYPSIVSSTQSILDFNDRYDADKKDFDMTLMRLENDLSFLGETLADRIELEDKVIDVMSESRN